MRNPMLRTTLLEKYRKAGSPFAGSIFEAIQCYEHQLLLRQPWLILLS